MLIDLLLAGWIYYPLAGYREYVVSIRRGFLVMRRSNLVPGLAQSGGNVGDVMKHFPRRFSSALFPEGLSLSAQRHERPTVRKLDTYGLTKGRAWQRTRSEPSYAPLPR